MAALLLGGGAPTLTLQAGALAALHERGVKFDIVSTAGAGMLIGLLYAAPKGRSPGQALAQTKEMGVHDSTYEHFPINFKVCHKPGRLANDAEGGRAVKRCGKRARPGRAGEDPAGRRARVSFHFETYGSSGRQSPGNCVMCPHEPGGRIRRDRPGRRAGGGA